MMKWHLDAPQHLPEKLMEEGHGRGIERVICCHLIGHLGGGRVSLCLILITRLWT